MLFDNEKRQVIKIKAKPSVMNLAKELYKVSYPFSSSLNIDDMFEEMVIRYAISKRIIDDPFAPRIANDFSNFDIGLDNSLEMEKDDKLIMEDLLR